MRLAINVAAMLIAFLAFIALVDALLGLLYEGLSLGGISARVFAPIAALMGVPPADVPALADLLGTKLVTNEFVAYVKLRNDYAGVISERAHTLATYALTGFANFGSVGILLGGVGAMAPARRGDLARLGARALLAGFLATLINASIAAMLL
jgi:CNT family concentrative nucleoside transporter